MKRTLLMIGLSLCLFAACEEKTKDTTEPEPATEPAIQEGTKGLKSAKKAADQIENKAEDRLKAVDEATGQ